MTCPSVEPPQAYSNTPFLSGVPCNGFGKCNIDGTVATCECDDEHFGAECSDVCPVKGNHSSGNHSAKPCEGHGKCGALATGGTGCFCEDGYQGDFCELACPGLGSSNGTCSGHGKCGMSMDDSNQQVAVCACDPNFLGPDCHQSCTNNCGGPDHGTCELIHKGNHGNRTDWEPVCKCNNGYTGSACENVCPGKAGSPCNNQGTCVTGDEHQPICRCFAGWHGLNCTDVLTCTNNCSNGSQGTCLETKGGNVSADRGTCYCKKHYVGDDCSIICPGSMELDGPCNDRGSCELLIGQTANTTKAVCKCFSGYSGEDCLTTDKDSTAGGSTSSTSFQHYGILAIVLVLVACLLLVGIGYLFILARRRKAELDKWRNPMLAGVPSDAPDAELQTVTGPSGHAQQDHRLDAANEDHFVNP